MMDTENPNPDVFDRDEQAEEKRGELIAAESHMPIQSLGMGQIDRLPMAAMAVAAQQQAIVRARFEIAQIKPRSELAVQSTLMAELKTIYFHERARYKIPNRGEGWTIRFAERLMQLMGNMLPRVDFIHDDDRKIIIAVEAMDLERNVSAPAQTIVIKTVERKRPPQGITILAQRTNSYGEQVSVIPATDEEVLTKTNSAISKAMRTCILRLAPSGILAACKATYDEVFADIKKKVEENPSKELMPILGGLQKLRISAEEVERYLGHKIDLVSPAQVLQLREAWQAVRNGEARWIDLRNEAEAARSDAAEEKRRPPSPREATRTIDQLKDRAAKKATPGIATPHPRDEQHANTCGVYVKEIGQCTCKED